MAPTRAAGPAVPRIAPPHVAAQQVP
jgi:hypothetical protein